MSKLGSKLRQFVLAGSLALQAALVPPALAAEPGVTDKEILLGGVFVLSGPVRLVTEPYEQAIRAYFNKVNAEGGINGRQIKWIVEDDAYQPARTLAGAKKLIDRDDVFLLFGQMGTPTTLAVAPYAEQRKIPFFSINASPEPAREYTFGFMANYDDIMYNVTKYMAQKLAAKRIAYFYQNDDLGEAGRKGVDRALKEMDMTLAADVGFERGTGDFGTHVLKLRDSKADAVISMAVAPSTATAIKQALGANYKPVWGTFSVGNSSPMRKLLGEQIDGLVYGSEIDSQYSDSPSVKELQGLMAKYYAGSELDWGNLAGYVHARFIVETLKAAGPNLTRESVMTVLNNTKSFDVGLMAPVSYAPGKRSAANAVKVFQWHNGRPVDETGWLPTQSATR